MVLVNRISAKTAKEAFQALVDEARHECGHGGYTGTIAEKRGFKMVSVPPGKDPLQYAEDCLEDDDHWCQDKWGDAACIAIGPDTKDPDLTSYCFFGWASC
jgi:hypothetical protein